MKHVTLPNSGMSISALSLGSYETFSRIEYRDIVDIVSRALEAGITLFDVAHYRRAPHTEVILARALEDAGAPDNIRIMTKVWKGEDPNADVVRELEETLFRLRRDTIDLVLLYGPRWGIDDPVEHARDALKLVDSGLAKSWGGINWAPEAIGKVISQFSQAGHAKPALMQLKYNIARRGIAESPEYQRVFEESGLMLQGSDSLEGGVLAGKNPTAAETGGRVLGRDPGQIRNQIVAAYPDLQQIADGFGVSSAELSLAYALAYGHTATVLFGASSLEQLNANISAVDLATRYGEELRTKMRETVNIEGHTLDVPPGSIVDPNNDPYRQP